METSQGVTITQKKNDYENREAAKALTFLPADFPDPRSRQRDFLMRFKTRARFSN